MSDTKTTPEVTWAQRSSTTDPEKNYVYLRVAAPDVSASNLKVDLQASSISVTGYSETKKTTYAVSLEFYEEVDVENSKTHHTSRDVVFVLRKKELKQEYWPRLLKEKQRMHFLKTDFDKWVDEDEQEAAPEENFGDMGGMGGMGGMPGMEGMGGMPGMGGGPGGFGDIDFSKLGGDAGAGADDDDADIDDEDDDMPGLEGDEDDDKGKTKVRVEQEEEEEVVGKGKGKESDAGAAAEKPKIEEVS